MCKHAFYWGDDGFSDEDEPVKQSTPSILLTFWDLCLNRRRLRRNTSFYAKCFWCFAMN